MFFKMLMYQFISVSLQNYWRKDTPCFPFVEIMNQVHNGANKGKLVFPTNFVMRSLALRKQPRKTKKITAQTQAESRMGRTMKESSKVDSVQTNRANRVQRQLHQWENAFVRNILAVSETGEDMLVGSEQPIVVKGDKQKTEGKQVKKAQLSFVARQV